MNLLMKSSPAGFVSVCTCFVCVFLFFLNKIDSMLFLIYPRDDRLRLIEKLALILCFNSEGI